MRISIIPSLNVLFLAVSSLFADWNVAFDENSSRLKASNDTVSIDTNLSFSANGKAWKVANSRDGVKNRFAILDDIGDAKRDQAYIKTANTETGAWDFVTVQTVE